jgi:hypothetical protein
VKRMRESRPAVSPPIRVSRGLFVLRTGATREETPIRRDEHEMTGSTSIALQNPITNRRFFACQKFSEESRPLETNST